MLETGGMVEGKFYPFDHRGKHYLLTKSKDNVIDFYEILGSGDSND